MTNIYDVLSKVQVKAHANLKAEIVDELKIEDPSLEKAKSILESNNETEITQEGLDESSEGDEQ
jgi:hypothetical protein|tara:strand:+ start:146 stop:337 length:192 start_codon:yes stop_codon:yes gene_type:complete